MWNPLDRLFRIGVGLIIAVMFWLAVISMAAFALTVPGAFPPRQPLTQQTTYIRINVVASGNGITANGISCAAAVTSGGNCSVRVGAVPYNAFLVRAYQQVTVAFNSTTTDTIGLGTASGTANQNILAAQSVHAAGAATSPALANPGITVTGNGIAQTGANGGFDVWVTFVYTGASIATAGQAVFVLEYIPSNDGSCADVPMGTTAPAC